MRPTIWSKLKFEECYEYRAAYMYESFASYVGWFDLRSRVLQDLYDLMKDVRP